MKTKLFSTIGALAVVINAAHAPAIQARTLAAPEQISSAKIAVASPSGDCKVSATAIPVPAGVLTLSVAPAATNSAITEAPQCPHYAALSLTARRQPELFVFLPGTNIEPMQQQMIVNQAAENGYYALALSYDNLLSEANACADPVKGYSDDPTCATKFREEVITGVPASPVVSVTVTNSVVSRLTSLIAYLDVKAPAQGWGQFLTAGGAPAWDKIRLGGHSQGSGHTGFIATQRNLARACMFSGPGDVAVYGLNPPASGAYMTMTVDFGAGALPYYIVPSTWVTSATATPAQRVYSFAHSKDTPPEPRLLNWGVMGHLGIAGLATVDGAVPPYGGSHALTTTVAVTRPAATPHGSVVVDDDTPLTASGLPLFAPVWQTMCFADLPNPQPEIGPCNDQCPDLGDAPDSNNSLGNPMSIHPFGLIPRPAYYPTEFTGLPGTGPIHLNAGSNGNPGGVPGIAIDSALGLDINQAGDFFSRVSNERNAFSILDQDVRKRNIIPLPNPANGRSNRDGFDNAFVDWAGNPLAVRLEPCNISQIPYAQFVHAPWAANNFYVGSRYINVWIDFNRDGDWGDAGFAGACAGNPLINVNEWFVRNLPTPGISGIFMVPGQFMPSNVDHTPFWLRISISDSPAPANSAGNGPAAGYRFGETEDHLMCYHANTLSWSPCPMLQLWSDAHQHADGLARVAPGKPVTFTASIEESAVYPVTVTWTIDGAGVTQIGASVQATAANGKLVVTHVLPTAAAPQDSISLGWYGCITCTLRAPATAFTGLPTPATINVQMVDAEGNQAGDEALVNVGWQAFMPAVQR